MALTKIGASLGGGADTIFVTQAGHGLSLGYPVKANGNGTYAHATANTALNAEAIGIIIERTTDTMLIALSGRITVDGCVPNLSAGTVLFLQVSAGLLAAAEPDGNNEVSKPMAVITYANSEMILLSHRGEVISTAGVVSAPTDAQYVTLAVDGTLSAERVLTAGSGITLTDAGANGAATISIANDAINSQHYAATSIDNEHLADNAVDTEEIAADAVTNAKLANMAAGTVKANATGSAANPTDVSLASATQATIAGDDVVLIYDTSATALATMTRTNFVAGVGSALQSTVKNGYRAAATASNSVPYTAAGFAPTAVIIVAQGNTQDNISFGFGDDANVEESIFVRTMNGTHVMERSSVNIISGISGSDSQKAVLTSLDADGMTLAWTKAGSGEPVNFLIMYLR